MSAYLHSLHISIREGARKNVPLRDAVSERLTAPRVLAASSLNCTLPSPISSPRYYALPFLFMASTLISLPCLRLAMPYRAGLRHRVSSQCSALPMRRASTLFLYSPLPFTAIIAVSWQFSLVGSQHLRAISFRHDAWRRRSFSALLGSFGVLRVHCDAVPVFSASPRPHRLETLPMPLAAASRRSLPCHFPATHR